MTKIIFGAVAVLLGVLMLLSAFDLFEFESIYPYWTLFIIVPTVASMITSGFTLWKTALLAVGINALICQQHWGEWGWKQFVIVNLAVCFILFGVYLLLGDLRKKKPQQNNGYNPYNNAQGQQTYYGANGYVYPNQPYVNTAAQAQSDAAGNAGTSSNAGAAGNTGGNTGTAPNVCDYSPHPNYTGILSNNKYKNASKDFKGGNVTAVLGGVEADYSDIGILNDITLNVTSVFGNIDIFVPRNYRIDVNGIEILGSCENFVVSSFGSEVPCLHIKYTTVFGSIDVKIR